MSRRSSKKGWADELARRPERAAVWSAGAFAAGALAAPALLALAARACAPYRAGTRFAAVPNVSFFCDGGHLRAPGARLPGASDGRMTSYLDRLAAEHPEDENFQVVVTHPQVLDDAMFSALRGLLGELVARIGVPVLPVTCELIAGRWSAPPRRPPLQRHAASLTLVAHGAMTTRLPGRRGLTASAGQLCYWPAGLATDERDRPAFDLCPQGGLAVRLWIPSQGARVTDAVRDVVAKLVEEELANDGVVAYLPYPAERGAHGDDATAPPLWRAARALGAVARGQALARAVQILWARRASACALEPVPPPLPPARLAARDLVTRVATPLELPLSHDLSVWAVNGHAFTVPSNAAAEQVLEATADGPRRVRDVLGAGASAARARVVLEKLVALRAIAVTSQGGARGLR